MLGLGAALGDVDGLVELDDEILTAGSGKLVLELAEGGEGDGEVLLDGLGDGEHEGLTV